MKPKTPPTVVAQNLALAGMVSQIGCVTVVIVIGALLLGLWLDNMLGTKPILTIGLLILSIPVSTYSLIRVALSTAAQFQVDKSPSTTEQQKTNDEQHT
jgi:F0F1-type ATP synthase assembly protein I